MRKILLATSALVAFSGAAFAAESPVTVTAEGYVNFRAAQFHEAQATARNNDARRSGDFTVEYLFGFRAEGKANGVDYGSYVSFWNGNSTDGSSGLAANGGQGPALDQAYVWVSGAYGKVIMGDETGASNLFVAAPTVGEGQINGSYTGFTDDRTLVQARPTFIDDQETATKITYITPKIGDKAHAVQLGVSYMPQSSDTGNMVNKYEGSTPYRDLIEGVLRYEGTYGDFKVTKSAMITLGDADDKRTFADPARSFTLWGLGAQIGYGDFTFGGSYVDAGHYATYKGLNQAGEQNIYSLGVAYEKDAWAFAVNALQGRGYFNSAFDYNSNLDLALKDYNYVKSFRAIGAGASYAWLPGMTFAADAVFFNQVRAGRASATTKTPDNSGHVLMISQKMAF